MDRVRWGVLSTAKIGTEKVIPAMQRGSRTEVVAIASRDDTRAQAAAVSLGIPRWYGSYEAMLADPEIDAIYNPLPNHLHVPWSIQAAEHGKHVLCEKPIGLTSLDAEALMAARDRTGKKIQEAFMVWTHPRWRRARDIVQSGRLGELRAYIGSFSYHNDDPANIRNIAAFGGGGLMDIGCYLIVTSRLLFGEEPRRVNGLLSRDPASGVDTLTSMLLDYPSGHAIGTCTMRAASSQRVQLLGSRGWLALDTPFNAPNDRPSQLVVDDGRDLVGSGRETIEIPTCDQYTVQGDEFSRSIQEGNAQPYPLEMTWANMRVIEAVMRSGETGSWETV